MFNTNNVPSNIFADYVAFPQATAATPSAGYQQWFDPAYSQASATTPAMQHEPTPSASSSDSFPSTASTAEWMIQWFDDSKKTQWNVATPQFKYCKKRKEHYSEQFVDIWYKAPYKYHMVLEVEGMAETENVLALVELNYEDGQQVVYNKTGGGKKSKKAQKQPTEQPQLSSGVVSNNENYFVHSQRGKTDSKTKSEVTIGPFQFNICSYKQDGRKFRMIIYLYTPAVANTIISNNPSSVSLSCCLISPPFTIRAKKPIVSPGIKKNKVNSKEIKAEDDVSPASGQRKRKSSDDEDEDEPLFHIAPEPKKQRTSTIIQPSPVPPSLLSSMMSSSHPLQKPSTPQQPTPVHADQKHSSVIDDFIQQLDAGTPASPLAKVVEKAPSATEKIQNALQIFKTLDDKDRRELLCHMLESSYPHEKEFIRRKYFEGSDAASMYPTTTTQNHHSQNDGMNYQYFVPNQQQHGQYSGTQSGVPDVDHFFVDLL